MISQPSTYLALGDSYTIGEGVGSSERWPVQLAALLRAEGLSIDEPQIIAQTGWTTDELLSAVEQRQPRGPFDLVSLLIGVNNQYRGYSTDGYRAEFRDLLRRAIALAGGDAGSVVVLSIPDWGVTPFARGREASAIAAQIDQFNAINREETALVGAHYVDVTPFSRTAAGNPALLAADGLHPSGLMYAEWARLALPPALAALSRQTPSSTNPGS